MIDLPRIHLSIITERMRLNILEALAEHHDLMHQYVDDEIQRLTAPEALQRLVEEETTRIFGEQVRVTVRSLVYNRLKDTDEVVCNATEAALNQLLRGKRHA